MAEVLGVLFALQKLLALSNAILDPLQLSQASAILSDRSVQQLLIEMTALAEVLRSLEPLCEATSEKDHVLSVDLIDACFATLSEVNAILSGYNRRTKIQRISWRVMHSQRLERLKADLDRHKATFSIILSAHSSLRSSNTEQEIKSLQYQLLALQRMNSMQLRERILLWVSPYDFAAREMNFSHARVAGTCEWVLHTREYVDWASTSGSMLWLQGKVGSGKSTLMSYVIDHIKETVAKSSPKQAIAFFYVDHRENPMQVWSKLLASLLRQLLQQLERIPQEVITKYETIGMLGRSLDLWMIDLLLHKVIVEFTNVYILIDGIDWIPRSFWPQVEHIFSELSQVGARIMVSSRYVLDRKTDPLQTKRMVALLQMKDHTSQDIRYYIREKLKCNPRLQSRDDFRQQVESALIRQSDGLYLWAELVMDELLRKPDPRQMQQALLQLPASLSQVYMMALPRVDSEHPQESKGSYKALQILQWLQASPRPLTVDELTMALYRQELIPDTSQDTRSGLLIECSIFVDVDSTSNSVRLIHSSVKDFLVSQGLEQLVTSKSIEDHFPNRDDSIGGASERPHVEDTSTQFARFEDESNDPYSDTASIWSDTRFSDITDASSQSLQSSVFLQLEPVVDQYAKLFTNERRLGSLIRDSLDTFGVAGFERLFTQMLRQYSDELLQTAVSSSQKIAAIMVGDKPQLIAARIVSRTGFLNHAQTAESISAIAGDNRTSALLNTRLQMLDNVKVQDTKKKTSEETNIYSDNQVADLTLPPSGTTGLWKFDIDIGVDQVSPSQRDPIRVPPGNTGHDQEQTYINLELIKSFLTSSAPFTSLVDILRMCLDPTMSITDTSPGRRSMEQDFKSVNPLIAVKPVTWWQKYLKMGIDSIAPPEPPLEKRMRRVRWTCVCKRHLFDDFYEIMPGAAEEIQASLDDIYRLPRSDRSVKDKAVQPTHLFSTSTSNIASDIGPLGAGRYQETSGSMTTSPGDQKLSPGYVSAASSADANKQPVPVRIPEQNGKAADLEPESNSTGYSEDTGTDSQRNKKQGLRVYPCFKISRSGAIAADVAVTDNTSDAGLFGDFRYRYFSQKSWVRRFCELREVTDIKFVMFNLTETRIADETNVADIKKHDVWPPRTLRGIWQYSPCPPRNIPLVGTNHLLHIWRNPHHADNQAYNLWRKKATVLQRCVQWFRMQPMLLRQKFRGLQPTEGSSIILGNLQQAGDREQPNLKRSRYIFTKIPKKIGEGVPIDTGDEEGDDQDSQDRDDVLGGSNKGKSKAGEEVDNLVVAHPDPYSAWGLCFEESFRAYRLIFALFILYVLASLGIISWYVIVNGFPRIQEWSEISWLTGWAATLLALFVTVWFKWAED